jgi:hypothetical protein
LIQKIQLKLFECGNITIKKSNSKKQLATARRLITIIIAKVIRLEKEISVEFSVVLTKTQERVWPLK